mmetsp:Transcript_64956/g.90372  ORF Transcript_64956/g.90372 Transcript_64956/m.90372 type:complete len:217 (-) Transcript_64956:48-698(-)
MSCTSAGAACLGLCSDLRDLSRSSACFRDRSTSSVRLSTSSLCIWCSLCQIGPCFVGDSTEPGSVRLLARSAASCARRASRRSFSLGFCTRRPDKLGYAAFAGTPVQRPPLGLPALAAALATLCGLSDLRWRRLESDSKGLVDPGLRRMRCCFTRIRSFLQLGLLDLSPSCPSSPVPDRSSSCNGRDGRPSSVRASPGSGGSGPPASPSWPRALAS